MISSSQSRARAKQDESIMETNNSCIVSKRSVEKYYLKDGLDFTKYFVNKLQRRSPLINRGYWLRMKVIEHVVREFLNDSDDSRPKAVVNLGCGYDTLPFKILHGLRGEKGTSDFEDFTFIDVDYPKLIEKKCKIIQGTQALHGLLFDIDSRPDDPGIPLRSKKYTAVSCDLNDAEKLQSILVDDLELANCSTLFVAEVSLTYMNLNQVNEIINMTSKIGEGKFCLLEQCLADGPNHPFALTMLKHFRKLQSPLRALDRYSSLKDQIHRFLDNGWSCVKGRNLWEIWQDDGWITSQTRSELDQIEPFDEWEDFALFASHYIVLEACNSVSTLSEKEAGTKVDSSNSGLEVPMQVRCTWRESVGQQAWRKHGAAISDHDHGRILHYGGQNATGRQSDVDVFEVEGARPLESTRPTNESILKVHVIPGRPIACHTITAITQTEYLLVGGRESPQQSSSSCYRWRCDGWTREAQLPRALFRHCAVPLKIVTNGVMHNTVLVFGGKWNGTDLSDDWLYWTEFSGWEKVNVVGPKPVARFGAAMAAKMNVLLNDSMLGQGFLTGGIGKDGMVLGDIWEWKVYLDNESVKIACVDRTAHLSFTPKFKFEPSMFFRFGARLVHVSNMFVLLGGISAKGTVSLEDEFLIFQDNLEVRRAGVLDVSAPRPILIGLSEVTINLNDQLVLVGGGVTCFSFGSFWNEACYSIHFGKKDGSDSEDFFRFVRREHGSAKGSESLHQKNEGNGYKVAAKLEVTKRQPYVKNIPRIRVQTTGDFQRILDENAPVIIEGLDIGACTTLWNFEYLKQQIGYNREVVVHDCTSFKMDFVGRNFKYSTMRFEDFLDAVEKGEKLYLRSISTVKPADQVTNLTKDFPMIAQDFKLPKELDFVSTNMHSSPMRISGPVAMWLHYDVMANVLCQISGDKRVILFNPSDSGNLQFAPGASSSQLDLTQMFGSTLVNTTSEARVNAQSAIPAAQACIADLKRGDVLFIPPLWPHSAAPTNGISIAVNVFFRNLANGGYAAGKDVYGNRDLQAYENGRRDVARLANAFKTLPQDAGRFYLTRLAQELSEIANCW